jgi:hypothetical protein
MRNIEPQEYNHLLGCGHDMAKSKTRQTIEFVNRVTKAAGLKPTSIEIIKGRTHDWERVESELPDKYYYLKCKKCGIENIGSEKWPKTAYTCQEYMMKIALK